MATATILNTISSYGAGTAFTVTNTGAQIVMGTVSPQVIIANSGVYGLSTRLNLRFNGATFASNRTVTVKLRRTNNNPIDIPFTTTSVVTGVVTTTTGELGIVEIPSVQYRATAGDIIQIYISVNVAPTAGSLQVTEASIFGLCVAPPMTPILNDSFSQYTTGSLVGQGPWLASPDALANIAVAGGVAVGSSATNGADTITSTIASFDATKPWAFETVIGGANNAPVQMNVQDFTNGINLNVDGPSGGQITYNQSTFVTSAAFPMAASATNVLAISYDGNGAASAFVNGVLVGTVRYNPSFATGNTVGFLLGDTTMQCALVSLYQPNLSAGITLST